jgi:hypothetical protein
LKYIEKIFTIKSLTQTFEIKSNEAIEFNANDLINDISDLGYLNVEGITRNKSGIISTENFGINYYQLLMEDNKFIPEKSNNTLYKYNLSFIEHIENDYTRIYYLNDVYITIKTCYSFK